MKYDYDLVIIGGGSAGLTAADTAVIFGKKVALVSEERLGGDCLWTGCVPSKTLIHAAEVAMIQGLDAEKAYQHAQQEINRARNHIKDLHDNAQYYESKGVDVYLHRTEFIDKHTLKVGTKKITSKYFLIATGSRASVPPISGLNDIPYITNESVFEMKKCPQSLIVLGGGPIGCELAQSFQRIGVNATVIQRGGKLIPKDELEASVLLLKRFEKEGITVLLNTSTKEVKKHKEEIVVVTTTKDGKEHEVRAEGLLVAIGRSPNVENLGLETIGIKIGAHGIEHNEQLQTNLSHIYVAGDIAGGYQFTHFASVQGSAAVRNIFLPLKSQFNPKVVPWVTYTDPEVAHAGESEEDLIARGAEYRTIHFNFDEIDRAIAEGKTDGFIKIMVDKEEGKVLGAQIMGARAGEMIHELVLAIQLGIPISKLLSMIHAYPTYSSGIQQALFTDFLQQHSSTQKFAKLLAKFT